MVACGIVIITADSCPVDLTFEPFGMEYSAAGPGEISKQHSESDRKKEERLELLMNGEVQENE